MSTYNEIYKIVCQIPQGRVATYGQVADLAQLYGKARLAGYALYRIVFLNSRWRVAASAGTCTTRKSGSRNSGNLAGRPLGTVWLLVYGGDSFYYLL
ncbi:methyltransferase [Fischerella thermalis CCMEE 5330]|uniref:Methyltransferase n=1 Tax=Fischerella thermalis CCMEE 5330 TaxID=2019670 RepID=A0A2N6MD63_9CYAN|nr:MGMT family protein [Fischerella thermalis]PMB44707.1 methyltransferase [Fischerella thermalis CCMEE 5330]